MLHHWSPGQKTKIENWALGGKMKRGKTRLMSLLNSSCGTQIYSTALRRTWSDSEPIELPARRLCKLQVLARCCRKSCRFSCLSCVPSPVQRRPCSAVDVPMRPDSQLKWPVTRVRTMRGRCTPSHTHTRTGSVSSQARWLSSGIILIRTQTITVVSPVTPPCRPATVSPSAAPSIIHVHRSPLSYSSLAALTRTVEVTRICCHATKMNSWADAGQPQTWLNQLKRAPGRARGWEGGALAHSGGGIIPLLHEHAFFFERSRTVKGLIVELLGALFIYWNFWTQ